MSDRIDLGWLWHGLGGLGITGGVDCGVIFLYWPIWAPFAMVGILLIGGTMRECGQHRWKAPWKLSLHQWLEALAWPVGGIVAAGLGLVLY